MKIWTPLILVIMAAERSRVRLLAHLGEQRGGVVSSQCGVEHRQQHFLLFAEVQQKDGGQPHELVGEIAGQGVVGPSGRHAGCRVGQAVDAE